MATQDRLNTLVLATNQTSRTEVLDQDTRGAVVRYRKDVGLGSTVGGMYTGRIGESYDNHVGGLDAFLRLSRNNTIQVQMLASTSQFDDSLQTRFGMLNQGQDLAGSLQFTHSSQDWLVSAGYEDVGRAFRADYGFLPRVDYREGTLQVQRILRGDADHWFSQLRIGVTLERVGDHDGRLTDQNSAANILFLGSLQSVLNLSVERAGELFSGRYYNLDRVQLFSSIQPSGKATFGLLSRFGDQIDVLNEDEAIEWLLMPSMSVKLGRAFRLSMSNTRQQLARNREQILLANIFQSNIRYNLSLRSFVRLILQYQTIEREVGLSNNRELFSQLLFSYKINPQTVLFLGYSDGYTAQPGSALLQTGRTFFFKLGYAFLA